MKSGVQKSVAADFKAGWIYSRHRRSLPPGALSDGQGMAIFEDEIMARECYERAYNTEVAPNPGVANLKSFYLPTGHYWVIAIQTNGDFTYWSGMSETVTPQGVTGTGGYSPHADARAFREAIWLTTGSSRPWRFVPSWPAAGAFRYQYAGCFAPLFSGTDEAIGTAVELGGDGGLSAGHYYYAMTLLYGTNGKWGESRPGAVGQVLVTGVYDGTARIVDSGGGLPGASSTYVPASDPRYYGAWGRRLYRTKQGGDRNGPYYFIQQVPDMSVTDFEDNLHDDELSDVIIPAKYLDDDEQIPPVCELCELHDNRMIYADATHLWWSDVGASGEPLPDIVHSVNNVMNLPLYPNEWVTAISSIRGALLAATNRRIFLVSVGSGAGTRVAETTRGCVAKKSWVQGRNGAFYLSSEGPAFCDVAQTYLLGGEEGALRIRHYLEDFCDNIELCCGMWRNGLYYLSYPDRRDSPFPENSCTRVLIWDDNLKCWYPPWDVAMNCMISEDSRILWVDHRQSTKTYVMQFNSSRLTDIQTSSGTPTAEAPTFRARFGSMSGNESGEMAVPVQAAYRAKVPAAATVTARAYFDDVAATAKTLTAAGMSNPTLGVYPIKRQMANATELEFKSTTAGGRWSLCSLDLEAAG